MTKKEDHTGKKVRKAIEGEVLAKIHEVRPFHKTSGRENVLTVKVVQLTLNIALRKAEEDLVGCGKKVRDIVHPMNEPFICKKEFVLCSNCAILLIRLGRLREGDGL